VNLRVSRSFALSRSFVLLAIGTLSTAQHWAPAAYADETQSVSWNPRSRMNLSGGLQFMPSEEQTKWNNRKPMSFHFSQAYTLLDAMGEWDLGGSVFYLGASGKQDVPQSKSKVTANKANTSASSVESASYDFSAIGIGVNTSYRFAYAPHPVVAPRFGLMLGGVLQNQNTLLENFTIEQKKVYKPVVALQANLELSLLALNSSEKGMMGFGYGLEDFVLVFGASYFADFLPKESYRLKGLSVELGLGLLFL
jgi:hypothetical protein